MASIRSLLLITLIAATVAACAGTGATPPLTSTTTTLMSGWEKHFTLEWAASPGQNGSRRLNGYVHNRNGEFAIQLRVLAQALDASGAVVGQRIEYVPGGVTGFARAYFEVPSMPSASDYRVSVWEYTWLQADSDRN